MAWHTTKEAIAIASEAGFDVSPRLVRTWIERGLIRHHSRRGLGRGRGVVGSWTDDDLRMFLVLLDHRARGAGPSQLCNLVVWLWLAWGEDYVHLSQARRALVTWVKANRTNSLHSANRCVRAIERKFRHPRSRRLARGKFREALTDVAVSGNIDSARLNEAVSPVFDPSGGDRARGPVEASITAARYVDLVRARLDAAQQLDELEDKSFYEARDLYLEGRRSYADKWESFAADPELGQAFERPDLNAVVNSACIDLITSLALGRPVSDRRETGLG